MNRPAGGQGVATFDAVVIGAGAGGLTVVAGLTGLGRRVALVEADSVGGDCTNVGCIPSKTLLDLSARLRGDGLQPGDRGWADAAAGVLAEVRERRDALRAHETADLQANPRLTLIRGRGRLVAADRVDVEDDHGVRTLRAPVVVLATGARAATVDLRGLPADRALTNATLFDLQRPPEHLAILGGGPIGAEMATAFARLGGRVTLVEAAPRVLPGAEPEASEVVARSLRALGVDLRTGRRATAYDVASGSLQLERDARPSDDGPDGDGAAPVDDPIVGVDRVLLALGRRPNVEGLAAAPDGLAALGIRVGPQGIVTDRAHRTTLRGVYAIGDVTERAKFTHAANAQGRRLVRHLSAPWLPLVAEGDYPHVTFTDPEVAQIGPTRSELRERWPDAAIVRHRADLADLDRGYVTGLRDGFVLLHVRRLSGRLLGATVVGPHAAEVVQLLTWAQRRRVSVWQLSRHVVAYPALAEGIKRAADAFVFSTLPALRGELAAFLRHRARRPGGPR